MLGGWHSHAPDVLQVCHSLLLCQGPLQGHLCSAWAVPRDVQVRDGAWEAASRQAGARIARHASRIRAVLGATMEAERC